MFDQIAEELKSQREKLGITLQEISTKTRIDLKFLQAIDDGNFGILPDVYLKAFLKSYASAIDLDPDEIIHKYDLQKVGRNISSSNSAENNEEIIKKESTTSPKKEFVVTDSGLNSPVEEDEYSKGLPKNTLVLIIAAVILLIVLALAYMFLFDKSETEIVKEQPSQVYNEDNFEEDDNSERFEIEQSKPEEIPAEAVNSSAPALDDDSVTLIIKANDLTWVRASYDNNTRVQDFNIQANTKRVLKAKNNFYLTVGNAGALEFTINNKPLEYDAKMGQVKRLRIDTSGIRYLRIQ